MSDLTSKPGYADVVASAQRIVHGRAARALPEPQDQADLLQEVLIRFFNTWGEDRRPDNVDAWLERTTQNALIDALRRNGREAVRMREQGSDDDPLEELLFAFREQRMQPSFLGVQENLLSSILALLSERDADLLRRRFVLNHRAADVAGDLGIAVNAVEQQVSRAKRRLREALVGRPDLVDELRASHPRLY